MLPPELLEADAQLYHLLTKVSFSRHLNPVNVQTARSVFLSGMEAPPLLYDAPLWADDALDMLRRLRIPQEHALGVELQHVSNELQTLITTLQDRSAEAFETLNHVAGWEPLPDSEADPIVPPPPPHPGTGTDALGMRSLLEAALAARHLDGWTLQMDPVMSARILVDAPKQLIRLNPSARFSATDTTGLIAHEIDVHACRGAAGARQPLRLFSIGLSKADTTEEGLAILAEERAGCLSDTFPWRQRLLHRAVRLAKTAGFREVYAFVLREAGASVAWPLTLRIKRGLRYPGKPGVYAKDTIYLRGWLQVRQWIQAGNAVSSLYVGKVGIQHPVEEWLKEGWLLPGPVPQLWA